MRQVLVLIPAVLLAATIAVNAQTIGDRSAIAAQVPTRINIGMNISERISSLSFEEQYRADQEIRRQLYRMAMEECALLAEVMRAECKLTSLSVNTNFQNNNDHPMMNTSVNGQYEIIPKR